jgi:hypothetical protein
MSHTILKRSAMGFVVMGATWELFQMQELAYTCLLTSQVHTKVIIIYWRGGHLPSF